MQQQQAYYQQQGMNPFPHMGMMMSPNGQYNQVRVSVMIMHYISRSFMPY
jgi:hypothetical protein